MTIYEIDKEMFEIFDELDYNFETGEVGPNFDEELYQRFMSLNEERGKKMQNAAKYYLNIGADIVGIKAEISRLSKLKKELENKQTSLLRLLDRECQGVKTDLGVACVNYRKTQKVELVEEGLTLAWLKDNKKYNAFKVEETINKNELKKIFKEKGEVPGAMLVDSLSCSIK